MNRYGNPAPWHPPALAGGGKRLPAREDARVSSSGRSRHSGEPPAPAGGGSTDRADQRRLPGPWGGVSHASLGGIVKTITLAVSMLLLFSVNGAAGEPPGQVDSSEDSQQGAGVGQPQDMNILEMTLPTLQQQAPPQRTDTGSSSNSPVSQHKVNYVSINNWPGNTTAQVKFQISMKFRVLEPNLYVFRYDLFPAYFAYTQKSLWNEGQQSMPFEESNYNPEFFLDYPVNAAIIGRLKLCSVVLSPLEHESNGLVGVQSRSWNRQYVLIRFGLESRQKLEVVNSFLADRALLYVKLWHASGFSNQDDYLQSIGKSDTFLDYMGRGELVMSVRNFLWQGSFKNHQLDVKTPIFKDKRKSSYEYEFRQQLPNMHFALYLQYWYGYGETLLRFDQFGRRSFVGLAFSY
jgi:phospholipase A1